MGKISQWLENPIVFIYVLVGFMASMVIINLIIDAKYDYVICQADRCYRAESYTKTKDGLEFIYDDKTRTLTGDSVIRER